ncbi:MAG: hypothetical protein Q9218_001722 [Villophora microphyllina]
MIVLCQRHFDSPAMPAPGQCMEQWLGTHDYAETGTTFSGTAVADLLHELVHFYHDSANPPPSSYAFYSEVYSVNECVELGPKKSLANPNNYVYYAFSIYQGCTSFPPAQRRIGRMKLGEHLVDASASIKGPDVAIVRVSRATSSAP